MGGKPVEKKEYDAVMLLRTDLMGSSEWRAKLLAGDAKAKREMLLFSTVAAKRLCRPGAHPMTAPAKTTLDRLAAAQAALAETNHSIATLQVQRREALVADNDDQAATVDVELVALRAHAARLVDKIALLGPLVEAETMARIPNDPKTGDEFLLKLTRRMMALEAKSRFDRSAADDAELDQLRCQIPYLRGHIETARRMSA